MVSTVVQTPASDSAKTFGLPDRPPTTAAPSVDPLMWPTVPQEAEEAGAAAAGARGRTRHKRKQSRTLLMEGEPRFGRAASVRQPSSGTASPASTSTTPPPFSRAAAAAVPIASSTQQQQHQQHQQQQHQQQQVGDGHTTATRHEMEKKERQQLTHQDEDGPLFTVVTTYIGYLVLILFGHMRDFFGKIFRRERYLHLQQREGYAPLNSDFDSFYTRRLYFRIRDCWNRPITGVPGRFLTLLERRSDDYHISFHATKRAVRALNFSSYNYLGFAQSEGPCADAVETCLRDCGLGLPSPRQEVGTSKNLFFCALIPGRQGPWPSIVSWSRWSPSL